MNYLRNESGELIPAVGQEGSHIRNKEQFDITIERLIASINVDVIACKTVDRNFLVGICEENGVPAQNIDSLIKSAFFYFDQSKAGDTVGI